MTPSTRKQVTQRMDLEELRACRSAVITIADAAAVLGVDARTVSRAVQSGELPALRVGRRLLIPRLPLLARLGVVDSAAMPSRTPPPSPDIAGDSRPPVRPWHGPQYPACPPPFRDTDLILRARYQGVL